MGRARITDGSADSAFPKPKLGERLQQRFLRPPKPGIDDGWEIPTDVGELEEANRQTNDRERLVGLFGAPLAAAIAILVIRTLVHDDPAHYLKDGRVNPLYTSVSLYNELLLVLLVLSLAILGFSMLRNRLLTGITIALYGLAIFNLHYWGFGVPFILAGAWLLVRAYRLSHGLKVATGAFSSSIGSSRPRPNKRYTPPGRR